jgi:hypothetical protein
MYSDSFILFPSPENTIVFEFRSEGETNNGGPEFDSEAIFIYI